MIRIKYKMFHFIFNLQFGSYPLSSCFLFLCCSACPLCAILHVNVVSFRCVATWRRWPASRFLWSKLLIVSCIISCSWCVETVGDPSWALFLSTVLSATLARACLSRFLSITLLIVRSYRRPPSILLLGGTIFIWIIIVILSHGAFNVYLFDE